MITVSFESRGSATLCDYLCDSIKRQIERGELKADERLPSKRALSENLGVSVITVQNAYSRLIDLGYLYSVEKKGFFVSDLLPVKSVPGEAGKERLMERERKVEYFADFTSGASNFERFPFSVWAHTLRRVLNSGDERLLERNGPCGVEPLCDSIARYLKEFRGMSVRPEQVVVGAGTENLYSMLAALLGRQRRIAVENPGYKKIYSLLTMNGVKCVPIKLDGHGMDMGALEASGADVAHVSPSHHFPTGMVMPVRRRQELLRWAGRGGRKRFIIEDDFDSEFRFNGKPLPTLQSEDSGGNVIYVNTFSKTLSPSFRIGYMVLPVRMAETFRKRFSFCSCPVSSFEQYTLAQFMGSGDYGAHIRRMKNYYRSLRNELIRALEESAVTDFCGIHEEDAGLHFLLTMENASVDAARIASELREKKSVRLPLLSDYFYGAVPASWRNTFVVNYGGIKKERIAETVARMEDVFRGL